MLKKCDKGHFYNVDIVPVCPLCNTTKKQICAEKNFTPTVVNICPKRCFVSFYGWAGEHNEVGAAFLIEKEKISKQDKKFFYIDDDIEYNEFEARRLAEKIKEESSGISDVHVQCIKTDVSTEYIINNSNHLPVAENGAWHIVFSVDSKNLKHVRGVNFVDCEKRYVFVLPKSGEFTSFMGSLTNNVRELYCMRGFCMK